MIEGTSHLWPVAKHKVILLISENQVNASLKNWEITEISVIEILIIATNKPNLCKTLQYMWDNKDITICDEWSDYPPPSLSVSPSHCCAYKRLAGSQRHMFDLYSCVNMLRLLTNAFEVIILLYSKWCFVFAYFDLQISYATM